MKTHKWGCILWFWWDAELADDYYFKHYNNTNKTMILYSPSFPMRPNLFRKWMKGHPMISRMRFWPGRLKEIYGQRHAGYLWRTSGVMLKVAVVAALMIMLTGVFGEYHS